MERSIGTDERCTCKCSCINKEEVGRLNALRNPNASIFGAPPTMNRPDSLGMEWGLEQMQILGSLGGFTPFGFSGLPSLLSFTSQQKNTRNSSEEDSNSTAAPSTSNSNSSPSAEVERLFDPFSHHLSFELKIPSLKL